MGDFVKEFMDFDFNINKIVIACFVAAGTGNAVHSNRPSHGLAMNLGGEKVYTFKDGTVLTVGANDIIYLPKFSSYTVRSEIIGDCYAINFDMNEETVFSPFVVNAKNYTEFLRSFRIANSAWKTKTNGYVMKCKSSLYDIIYLMKQEYFGEYLPKSKNDIILPAVDYIHENYTNEIISISELAKMCNITPEYFRKIFKGCYGTSPVKYINNLKISRARELIETGMYSITEAAHMSGYCDMSHFSREFKKAEGIPPSEI
ncbi:MAG: helix-turn-helix transcriptional regulator [Ruminococcaceae bacterium]|nr:helix-turn-helix transcriptional regulator [Oscillospiraceae bacterium]